ncbi:hypothetical protein EDF62_1538 [Leucobacter luti]|uniref:Uncharacterized protein n=1 Tax=Leucobacter luti TaxID=340320 RepID=A0A4R6RYU0_9MICO|nr:hypothetical protein EDF62_1538 [Leucobacter luti]
MMSTVSTRQSDIEVERQAFLYGDCWVLALALHRMFGFRMVFAAYWPEDEPGLVLEEWCWDHVFVETHAGYPLDVEGRPNLSKWRSAPDGYVRGFHLTDDPQEIATLLYSSEEPRERYYDVPVLPAIVRLAWQWPEAFSRMPKATLNDLPDALQPRIP